MVYLVNSISAPHGPVNDKTWLNFLVGIDFMAQQSL